MPEGGHNMGAGCGDLSWCESGAQGYGGCFGDGDSLLEDSSPRTCFLKTCPGALAG